MFCGKIGTFCIPQSKCCEVRFQISFLAAERFRSEDHGSEQLVCELVMVHRVGGQGVVSFHPICRYVKGPP